MHAVREPAPDAGGGGYSRHARGAAAEQAARRHLESQGLRVLLANFRTRLGELDLVLLDGEVLVIAEVRYRASAHFGGAAGSVDGHKRRRLAAAAGLLLRARPALASRRVRFDVVLVGDDGDRLRCEWLRDAFRT